MQRTIIAILVTLGLIAAHSVGHDPAQASDGARYMVKVTNVTYNQSFTPILAATHRPGVYMFREGTQASSELQTLAEFGDVAPLMGVLASTSGVHDMVSTAGLLTRGVTTEFEITSGTTSAFMRLSLAAMLIPTNDAFFGLETDLPSDLGEMKVVYAYAYDAGTEANDELCSSIPPSAAGQVVEARSAAAKVSSTCTAACKAWVTSMPRRATGTIR